MRGMDFDAFTTWLTDSNRRALVMGVLNVTPDSFSDGGRFAGVEAAVEQAAHQAASGADLIDIGGESTRPGAQRVSPDEQIARVVPVIEAIRRRGIDAAISIDTTRAAVAQAALDAGANLVNDISAGTDDPAMFALVAQRHVPIVLMHMQGRPKTMQQAPAYDDVVAEVRAWLAGRIEAAVGAGIKRGQVLIDPGIGFGKTLEHNLELLRNLGALQSEDVPMVLGTSRKRFIGTITGEDDPAQRLFGTAASVAWCISQGAAIVRVHDVKAMAQVVRMTEAILGRSSS